MNNFNLFYHGSSKDVADALEAGVDLDQYEVKGLLCNIMRKLIVLEEKAAAPARIGRPYKVTVQKMIAFGPVHELDENIEGEYPFCAISEEDALDQFHLSVPVKMLEDFAITAEPVQEIGCPDCGTSAVEEAIGQVCGTCHRGVIR